MSTTARTPILKKQTRGQSWRQKCVIPTLALIAAASFTEKTYAMDEERLKCLSYTIWIAQVAYRADVDPVDDMIKMCELTDDSYAEVSEFYEVATAKDPWIFKKVYGEKAFETFKEVSAEAVKRTQIYEAKMLRDIPIK